jgi:hypothetical protein
VLQALKHDAHNFLTRGELLEDVPSGLVHAGDARATMMVDPIVKLTPDSERKEGVMLAIRNFSERSDRLVSRWAHSEEPVVLQPEGQSKLPVEVQASHVQANGTDDAGTMSTLRYMRASTFLVSIFGDCRFVPGD